ncbi:STAS domain-containing protein [Pseudonocardia hydrocarbonoxydans]|uniref:STAS domain-containing protein n=1 Tax=Pseudonocardia hydrocarbonoxydans TaxID=76726 RepID=A0A4Y3WMN1_9PSEU|nr:STAS domain-containing protein [Pseudonocardia hydrocarbonoxydans]GEC20123.1 hypothetical protein PHY01_24060 [Pseudonocardia hydrocarbonoxydans]
MTFDRPDGARRHRLESLLHVDVDGAGPGVRVVRPDGDVDLETAPMLRAALAAATVGRGVRLVVVDLDGVGFFGASGIQILLDARGTAGRRGAGLVLAGGPPAVLRVLELVEVLHTDLAHAPTVRDAVAAGISG